MIIQLIPKWRKFLKPQRFCTAVPCWMARRIDSFFYGKNALSNETHFYCSCHATWHPCKTSFVLMLIGPCCCLVLSGLHTAYSSFSNSCWETQVGVCERHKKGGKHVCKLLASYRNVFADCFYAVHTHAPT